MDVALLRLHVQVVESYHRLRWQLRFLGPGLHAQQGAATLLITDKLRPRLHDKCICDTHRTALLQRGHLSHDLVHEEHIATTPKQQPSGEHLPLYGHNRCICSTPGQERFTEDLNDLVIPCRHDDCLLYANIVLLHVVSLYFPLDHGQLHCRCLLRQRQLD